MAFSNSSSAFTFNSSTSAFSSQPPLFGNTAPSASTGSLFGVSPTPSNSMPFGSTNLFGASSSAFGAPVTSNANIFGSIPSSGPSPFGSSASSGASLFAASASSGASLFATSASSGASWAASSSSFGMFGAPQSSGINFGAFGAGTVQSNATAQSSGFNFSAQTAASAQSEATFLFGNSSAAPATTSMAPNLFSPAPAASAPVFSLVNQPSTSTSFGTASSTTGVVSSSSAALNSSFGISAASSSLAPGFSSTTTQPASSSAALFSLSMPSADVKPNPPSFLFGSASDGQSSTAGGLFNFGTASLNTTSKVYGSTDSAHGASSGQSLFPISTPASSSSTAVAASLFTGTATSNPASFSSSTTATGASQAAGGFSFGNPGTQAQPTTGDKPPSSGGFSLGASATEGASQPASASAFTFGSSAMTGSTSAGAEANSSGKAAESTFSSSAASTAQTAFTAVTGFGFSSSPAVVSSSAFPATASSAALAGVQSSGTPLAVPSDIKDLSLDEVVNKWNEEVADLASQFEKGAEMVSKWDRAIVSNEDKIRALHRDAQSLRIAHKELSDNLDVVLSQQTELHKLLDDLELDVERKIGSSVSKPMITGNYGSNSKFQGEVEREAMHRLSIEIMEELDSMGLKIRDLVMDLNKGSDLSGGDRASDTVSQIISVFNAHLDSLQYLDETSSALHKRVTDVQRACELATRESERVYGRRTAGLY